MWEADLWQYMKNYPFAKARIKREEGRNLEFKEFVRGHTALLHAKRRDIVSTVCPHSYYWVTLSNQLPPCGPQ